jgi:hypothetical protein
MKIQFVAFLCFIPLGFLFGQAYEKGPYKIDSLQALLFYNVNNSMKEKKVAGTFSTNIIDNKEFHLWNTIIGEGSAEGSSSQTLVIVTISGNLSVHVDREIVFRAVKYGKEMLKRTDKFSLVDGQLYYMAYILYETGCGKVDLTVKIVNKGNVESQLQKSIEFECGE